MTDTTHASTYNPDVLSCLANLSNDEVFTPPKVANAMLDMLPQELFSNPDTTFLDPACKSGIFLREIAKRLLTGLEPVIPDLQERIDHIFQKQLFGIAITTLTSLLSRRSVYCSKKADGKYSVSHFDNEQGNIRFKEIRHRWKDGKCEFCGASQAEYGPKKRGKDLETHAYELIHTTKPEDIFKMKFDVIIGNPPYQLETGGSGRQAKPIYNLFVEQAKKLNPRYLSLIIPARWYAGGMGMDSFRANMLEDNKIRNLVDYPNAKDCFSGLSISGGVCYFLWDRDHKGDCQFTTIMDGKENTTVRALDEFSTLVRYNQAVNIIHKIQKQKEKSLSDIVSPISPFGLSTKERGFDKKTATQCIKLFSSAGQGYISRKEIEKGHEWINSFKVMVSQTGAEHAGEPSKDGKYRVLTSSMQVLSPNEICTHSYLVIGNYTEQKYAENLLIYLKTTFVRFLILQAMTSIHLTKSTFAFVPQQDFSKPWTDTELYEKYSLTEEETAFIESMIKPMDLGGNN